jgi:transcriptional regulator with XRE-family HTH domain
MNDILGENIARLRKEKGMTQEDLARELNISYQAVSKWENGISSPDISNIKLLAQFFGVSIDALFGLELLPREKEKTPVTDEEPDALDREPDALNRELDAPEDARKEPEEENRPAAGPERRDSAETAMLPWDDDNTLRAVLFKGRRLLSAEEVQRGIFAGKVSLEYNGDALNVFSFFDVSCGAVSGNVESGGDVRADAVGGFVSAQGDVNCGNVGAAVNCGGDVDCGDVGGDVRAGDDVDCGTVIGSVSAGGDVNCGVVRGNVSASGDVKCGIVGGRES